MKKILIAGIISIFSIGSYISPVFATNEQSNIFDLSETIPDKMTYIGRARSTLKISSNGSASIIASVTGVSGVNKSTITSYLQQYKNNKWTTIATFSASGTQTCNLSKSKIVTKGYKYRVSSVVKVFKGNLSEQKTVNSSSVNY